MFGGAMIDALLKAAVAAAYARTFQGCYNVAMRCGLSEPVALVIGALGLAMLMTLLSLAGLVQSAVLRTTVRR
jgi:hypothetical protein